MKRKIIRIFTALIVMLMLIASLNSCTDMDTSIDTPTDAPYSSFDIELNLQRIHSEYFDVEVVESLGGGSLVVRDKNTNVLYLLVTGYRAAAITPIYNSDGTVKLYEE